MIQNRVRASRAVLLAAIVFNGTVGASASVTPAQVSPAPAQPGGSVDDRLTAIRTRLLAGTARVEDVIVELKGILGGNPQSAMAHILLGYAYVQQGSPDMLGEAVAEFRQALDIAPALVAARFYLARAYLDLSQPGRAKEEMSIALAQMPRQPEFLALLGEAERQLGDAAQAVDITQQSLAIDPAFAQARYYLSLALLDLQRQPEAILQLEHLAKAGASIPSVYFTLGSTYLANGRIDDALAALNQGIRLGPAKPDVRIQLAQVYRLKGMLTEADAQLDAAFAPDVSIPASAAYQRLEADFNIERGLIRLQQDRLDEAVAAFRKSLDMDPERGPAHRYLAEIYVRQKRFKQASEHATRADELGATLPDVLRIALRDGLRAADKGKTE
jgi:tetratricopeptide (TPR) repeat protein